ncbi:hypothetical protein ACH4F6_31595 [Streptomyces sp. NPDC017936]|uniref:hypothetical protein n=1 Tax=Streptomyces sp. NPDC017936 TaxID=3365016 RepID=UPI003799489D
MPAARALSLTLEAEVMADIDTGSLSLVASTDPQLADLGDVTPARLREMVATARTQLAEFERLADEQDARDTLATLLAERDVQMEEWDTETLDPKLRREFVAFAMVREDGLRLVVVPTGQDPIARLAAVRDLIEDMQGGAA